MYRKRRKKSLKEERKFDYDWFVLFLNKHNLSEMRVAMKKGS